MHLEYLTNNNVFVFRCSYDERAIPKQAGFRWDPNSRVWWTQSTAAAGRLVRYADPSAQGKLADRQTNIKESYASASNLTVPCPEGREYYPYQLAGIEFLAKRDSALLSDDMGLGKTIQVIGLVNLDTSIKRVLVICPAIAKYTWKAEFDNWCVRPLTVGVVNSGDVFPHSDVVIINFDIVHKYYHELRSVNWDIRVIDEGHKLKNPKTRRCQHVLGKWDGRKKAWEIAPIPGRKRIVLTGTPIVNRPIELWPIIRALDPDTWNSWHNYTQRYCRARKTRWGLDVTGASNLQELGLKLRSTIMIRRLKKDVLKELPSKTRQVIEVPADSVAARMIDKHNVEYGLRVDKLLELEKAVGTAEVIRNDERYSEVVDRLKEARSAMFAEMSEIRHETAKIKIPIVLNHLEDLLENEQKIVFFCHHKVMVEVVYEKFKDIAVVVTGEVSPAKRFERVEQFQNDPKILLFIGNIQAAGVNITLTASSHCCFGELDWVSGNITQCEDRLLRIGQQSNVMIQHIVYERSIDARMAKMLVAKQQVIDKVMDPFKNKS